MERALGVRSCFFAQNPIARLPIATACLPFVSGGSCDFLTPFQIGKPSAIFWNDSLGLSSSDALPTSSPVLSPFSGRDV